MKKNKLVVLSSLAIVLIVMVWSSSIVFIGRSKEAAEFYGRYTCIAIELKDYSGSEVFKKSVLTSKEKTSDLGYMSFNGNEVLINVPVYSEKVVAGRLQSSGVAPYESYVIMVYGLKYQIGSVAYGQLEFDLPVLKKGSSSELRARLVFQKDQK